MIKSKGAVSGFRKVSGTVSGFRKVPHLAYYWSITIARYLFCRFPDARCFVSGGLIVYRFVHGFFPCTEHPAIMSKVAVGALKFSLYIYPFATTISLYFSEAFEIPKDFSRKVLCVRVWGRSPNLLFFRRKVGKRTSPRLHHFILAKLLKFQETFLEKFLVSGFGADAPTYNAHEKTRISPRFLFFRNMLELPFQASALRGF